MTEKTIAPELDDEFVVQPPDISHLITEDDTPVDNIFSERQMALLRETLYTSWAGPGDGRTFVAMGNVAIYAATHLPPLVPDMLVSLDVTLPADPLAKEHRCYFLWEYGKPPEVVVEIVSNRKGGELANKLLDYARLGVAYYVVYDPDDYISQEPLRIFTRQATSFVETTDRWLAQVELGVVLWQGNYGGMERTWLRWCDRNGTLLATGLEAKMEERQRAEQERQRAEAFAAKLRALGIDPDAVLGGPGEP